MNLTINSLSSVDRAYGLSSQNKNSKKENVSFEGLNISSKQVKNAAVGFALFSASVLGLSACKSNSSEKSKEAANTEYVAPVQDVEESEKSEVAKEVSYEERINEYMAQDKKVVKVEISDSYDPALVNAYRMITAEGYDKNGKVIREVIVYPHEPSPSCSYPTYYSDRDEYAWIQYLPDRKVTEYSYPEEEGKTVVVEYNKPVKFDGESGYKKTEVEDFPDQKNGIYTKTVTYVKGKAEDIGDRIIEYSKDFRKCILYYDKDGKLLEKRVLVPDKNYYYQGLILDEKKSILPKDISEVDE